MSNAVRTHRRKRYTIDTAALGESTTLGNTDPDTGFRTVFSPILVTEYLATLLADPNFDRERYCGRCDDYDGALGIRPWQLRPPYKSKRSITKVDPVGLDWQPAWPADQVDIKERHKFRPAGYQTLRSCHGCYLSLLDEQELPDISPELQAKLKAAFAATRAEVSRLHQSRARETRPHMLAYIEELLRQANARLTVVANACRDAGFEPFRAKSRRDGEEAPSQVVATEITFTHPEKETGPRSEARRCVQARP